MDNNSDYDGMFTWDQDMTFDISGNDNLDGDGNETRNLGLNDEEILDRMNIKTIENYLRKRKLKKINKNK